MSEATIDLVRNALVQALSPTFLDIEDEGYLHHGHAAAASGLGYFCVTIWSEAFAGCSRIDIHKKIYHALGTLMQTHIHALSIVIKKPL